MVKSYKVMLSPNNRQITKLFQYAGAARFAYNWALSREQENYKENKTFLSDGELRKEFTILKHTEEYSWLNNISNDVTKQAIKDACNAYKKFFKKMSGFPKYKTKKKSKPSFYQDTIKIKFTDTHVKVEGLANNRKKNRQVLNYIRLTEKGRIPTNCKYLNPRFSFDGLHWWVSVSIEFDNQPSSKESDGIGIDLGIKDLAVCSDGSVYKNINKTKIIKDIEKKKRRLQRSISRSYEKNKVKGKYCKTNNIIKKEKLLLRLNHRLTNINNNYLHQTTTDIINRNPRFICIEDLNVSGMMQNKHLSKAVQDQKFYTFRRQLEYKCEFSEIPLIIADRFFPSSKLCSCCGNIKKDLKLSDRTYRCECGNVIDRDFQASLNLKVYGENNLH